MTALTLTEAQVLWPEGLAPGPLGVAEGRIVADSPGPRVALPGCTVLPGIVDIHGDGFERHLAPRRGALRDLAEGLAATEAELAANGVTTAMLAQFWSWEGGMRGPDFARRMLDALAGYRGLGTDLRAQLRVETHLLDDADVLVDLVAARAVAQVVFNDHLPHAALAAGKRPPRLTGQALKGGRSPEAHLALMQGLHARSPEVPAMLAAVVPRLHALGVVTGSHDDATPEDRARWHALGVRLSEFPETAEAARAARAAGDGIVLGAPNVVRGGSHAGKVSAAGMVAQGLCDALASDYHYPAPRQAALALAGRIGLAAAWRLVSEGPARLLGLTDRGRIAPGLRADLTVQDPGGRVCLTLAAGRVTHASGTGAAALLTAA